MARLNLTIPDPLHERLERHRDELNISKLVAEYLAGVVDELEAVPKPVDPAIVQLAARLQSAYDQWFSRGYADGRNWALHTATREELQHVGANFVGVSGEGILSNLEQAEILYGESGVFQRNELHIPDSFRYKDEIRAWEQEDLDPEGNVIGASYFDQYHYFDGWREAVVEIWTAVEPLLRRVPELAKTNAKKQMEHSELPF